VNAAFLISNLIPCWWVKREKRFLLTVNLQEHEKSQEIIVHLPNTGSMKNCYAPGDLVLLSWDPNPKRKYPYTAEVIFHQNNWILINTHLANKIVHHFLRQQLLFKDTLWDHVEVKQEIKVEESRLDFLIIKQNTTNKKFSHHYIEVKNVTYSQDSISYFPDSPSSRAFAHLEVLENLVQNNHQASMLYLVSHQDNNYFSPAKEIDAKYSKKLEEVHGSGVDIIAQSIDIKVINSNSKYQVSIELGKKIQVRFS
jgi:sugar fermentation stimulation protein A